MLGVGVTQPTDRWPGIHKALGSTPSTISQAWWHRACSIRTQHQYSTSVLSISTEEDPQLHTKLEASLGEI